MTDISSGYRRPLNPYSNRYKSDRIVLPANVGAMRASIDGGSNGQLRSVSQRTVLPTSVGGSLPYMVQVWHTAAFDFDTFGVDFPAWAGTGETALTGSLTINGASFVYPGTNLAAPVANDFVPLTFGNALSITKPGGSDIIGDEVRLRRVIRKGEKYYTRHSWVGSTQIPYTGNALGGSQYIPGGDAIRQTATNLCYSGQIVDEGIGIAMYPSICKARTSLKNIPSIVGDSRECGAGPETPNASGILGAVCEGIAGFLPFLRLAISGDSVATWLATHQHRLAMALAYSDFIICTLGINDIYSVGSTGAQVAAKQQQLAALFPGFRFYVATLMPETTSNNNWADQAGQTLGVQNANTQAYNALVIAPGGLGGLVKGSLDIRSASEFGLNSGKIITTGVALATTPDGVHPQRPLCTNVVGLITPAMLGIT